MAACRSGKRRWRFDEASAEDNPILSMKHPWRMTRFCWWYFCQVANLFCSLRFCWFYSARVADYGRLWFCWWCSQSDSRFADFDLSRIGWFWLLRVLWMWPAECVSILLPWPTLCRVLFILYSTWSSIDGVPPYRMNRIKNWYLSYANTFSLFLCLFLRVLCYIHMSILVQLHVVLLIRHIRIRLIFVCS